MIIKMRGRSEKAPAFYISRNDAGQQIGADLDIDTTGYTIKLEGTKQSGVKFEEDCKNTGAGFAMNVTEQMTDEPGTVRAQVVLYGTDDERMGSERVFLMVEPLGGIS